MQLSRRASLHFGHLASLWLCKWDATLLSASIKKNTEAGWFAIRARRKVTTENDFLDAVNKESKAMPSFPQLPST
jgi:ATP-dependent 26S proteasome regulatory subunit